MNKTGGLQDYYLNRVRKDSTPVIVYLINGFQLRGLIKAFDNFTIVLEGDGKQQMIYKHAISTFVPQRPIVLQANDGADQMVRKPRPQEDAPAL
jgi:host factor-I protein